MIDIAKSEKEMQISIFSLSFLFFVHSLTLVVGGGLTLQFLFLICRVVNGIAFLSQIRNIGLQILLDATEADWCYEY